MKTLHCAFCKVLRKETETSLICLLKRKGADFFNSEARELFFDENGEPLTVGAILKNPALAKSFQLIAAQKDSGFYEGELAGAIIKAAQKAPVVASQLSLDDLKTYKAKVRTPVCGTYLKHKVCGMGAPSSGGMTVAMILSLIEPLDLGKSLNAKAMHLIAEAEKLSFADRNHYMADPDFVPQPSGFLSPDYISKRRGLISETQTIETAEPGDVPLLK